MQPSVFDPVTQFAEACAFYARHKFVVVEALSPEEVAEMDSVADLFLSDTGDAALQQASGGQGQLFYPLLGSSSDIDRQLHGCCRCLWFPGSFLIGCLCGCSYSAVDKYHSPGVMLMNGIAQFTLCCNDSVSSAAPSHCTPGSRPKLQLAAEPWTTVAASPGIIRGSSTRHTADSSGRDCCAPRKAPAAAAILQKEPSNELGMNVLRMNVLGKLGAAGAVWC